MLTLETLKTALTIQFQNCQNSIHKETKKQDESIAFGMVMMFSHIAREQNEMDLAVEAMELWKKFQPKFFEEIYGE